jgi:hypothetical protein
MAMKPAAIALACLFPSLTAAAWAAGGDLPRVDQCRVVYVCDADTNLFQCRDGAICIESGERIYNDDCRQRRAADTLPFQFRRLRDFDHTEPNMPDPGRFEGLDDTGRAWFFGAGSGQGTLRTWTIANRKCRTNEVAGWYSGGPNAATIGACWPWKGGNMLCDRQGGMWLESLTSLHRLGEKPAETRFPRPSGTVDDRDLVGSNSNMACLDHQTYRFGDSIWVVRSMKSNCHTPGAFVVRFTGDNSHLESRLVKQFVNGLVYQGGDVYILVEDEGKEEDRGGRDSFVPASILRIRLGEPASMPADKVPQWIADLDAGKWTVREEATRQLSQLPSSQLGLLRDALKQAVSIEQKTRLEEIIAKVAGGTVKPVADKLEGMDRGRLVFIDRQGRQYVQPWSQQGPEPRILVLDGNAAVTMELPSADVVLDCLAEDGTVYGRDKKYIYAISPAAMRLRAVASLGELSGQDVPVLAARQGMVCIRLSVTIWGQPKPAPVWLDLTKESTTPLLGGKAIAEGLPLQCNRSQFYQVAAGPGGRLWFVRHKAEKTGKRVNLGGETDETEYTQIMRARGDKVESLCGMVQTSTDPSVWPLADDAAIVATQWGWMQRGVLFYQDGNVETFSTLKELVEARHKELEKVMDDGVAFTAGPPEERLSFLRMGGTFHIHDFDDVQVRGGGGRVERDSLFRDGGWVETHSTHIGLEGKGEPEPFLGRLVDLDPNSHRVLGFQGNWKTLRWIPMTGDAAKAEDLLTLDQAWAWVHFNKTHLPRFTGAWTMTPDAARRWAKLYDQRVRETADKGIQPADFFTEYQTDDFAAFRRWRGGQWRTLDHSLYGTEVFEDEAGGVWQFCAREATVSLPGGRDQLIALDGGGAGDFRLAVETPDRVWVASRQSLWQFSLARDASGRPLRWEGDRRFRLPRNGLHFAGPWVVGKHLYYVSAGSLYCVALDELAATAMPAEAE